MKDILVLSALLISGGYAIVNMRKANEGPDSVSSFSYISGVKGFVLWAIITSALLGYSVVDVLPEHLGWLSFALAGGLLSVGASPLYRSENKVIHYFGGYLFGVVSQVIVFILNPYWLLLWVFFPLVFVRKGWRENATFISELICFVNLTDCLLFSDK